MFANGRLIPFLSSGPEVTKLTVADSFVRFLTTNYIFLLNAISLYLVLKFNLNQLENYFSDFIDKFNLKNTNKLSKYSQSKKLNIIKVAVNINLLNCKTPLCFGL